MIYTDWDPPASVRWELPYLSGCGSPAAHLHSLSGMMGCWTSCWVAGGGAEEPQVLPDWGLLVEAQVAQMLPRTCRPLSLWTVLRSGQWKRWGRSEGLCPGGGGRWKPPSSVPAWWRSAAPKTCEKQRARSKGRQCCGSQGQEPTEVLCWRAGRDSRGSGPLRGVTAANWGHAHLIPSWSRTWTSFWIQDDQMSDANPPGSVKFLQLLLSNLLKVNYSVHLFSDWRNWSMNAAQLTEVHRRNSQQRFSPAAAGRDDGNQKWVPGWAAILNISVHQQAGRRREMGSIQGSQSSAQAVVGEWSVRSGGVEEWGGVDSVSEEEVESRDDEGQEPFSLN